MNDNNNNDQQPPPVPPAAPVPPPPAAEPPALANDDTQWRITWSAPGEEPEITHRNGFRRAYAVATGIAYMENDASDDEDEEDDEDDEGGEALWFITDRSETWQIFAGNAAVATVIIALHPDGRTIRLTRL
jgi:hypothetical protein